MSDFDTLLLSLLTDLPLGGVPVVPVAVVSGGAFFTEEFDAADLSKIQHYKHQKCIDTTTLDIR